MFACCCVQGSFTSKGGVCTNNMCSVVPSTCQISSSGFVEIMNPFQDNSLETENSFQK